MKHQTHDLLRAFLGAAALLVLALFAHDSIAEDLIAVGGSCRLTGSTLSGGGVVALQGTTPVPAIGSGGVTIGQSGPIGISTGSTSGITLHAGFWPIVVGAPGAVEPLACDDGIDNDGDGLIDYPNDRGCTDASDLSERDWTLICDDGVDNDGDTLIDYPNDPGCYNTLWVSENPQCMDGIDNDKDGMTDYPDDPACVTPFWFIERSQCQDGINNDPGQDDLIDFDGGQSIHGACSAGICPPGVSDPNGDGVADPDPECVGRPGGLKEKCGLGAELVLALAPLMWLWRRRSHQ